MSNKIKVLLLGGTGAMGVYLVPELIKRGYKVDVTTRSGGPSGINVKYIVGDARDNNFMINTLKNNYDVIIDFMVYNTDEFKNRIDTLLSNTKQYFFISTYRVFADSKIITEDSPRLIDVCKDLDYLSTDEYALTKARQEDILKNSNYKNWTILRPSITYSKNRLQLEMYEADVFVYRSLNNKTTILPSGIEDKATTMTWAGDVAKMICGLILNKKAFCEDFNVVTSENHTWGEIINIYKKYINLKIKFIDMQKFINRIYGINKYQVIYDRSFNRVMDNSKILKITNLEQSDLKEINDGLSKEINYYINNYKYNNNFELNSLINDYSYYPIKKIRTKLCIRTRLRRIWSRLDIVGRLKLLKRNLRVRTRFKLLIANIKNGRKGGAIISLTGYYNYGNVLQRYALKSFLEKNGKIFDSIKVQIFEDRQDESIYGNMISFVNKYIKEKDFNNIDIQGYKNYIVGSDQVWRDWYDGKWERFSPFFLDFTNNILTNRIAYAASFGVDKLLDAGINENNIELVKPLMSKFNYISVREDSGVDLVRSIVGKEYDVDVVLDPVLLLEKSDYSSIIDNSSYGNYKIPKVFCYILDNNIEKENIINNISKKFNDKKMIVSSNASTKYKPVEVWLKGFRDSEFVITDSFHGMVLSIINQKDFIVLANYHRGLSRMKHLLKSFGIDDDRLIFWDKNNIDNPSSLKKIDWKSVNKKIDHARIYSSKWLLGALANKRI